jgi:hypothetical protein
MSTRPDLWLDDGSVSLASSVLSSCERNPSWVLERRGCTFSTLFLLGCYTGVLPHMLNLFGFSQDRDEFSLVHGTLWDWNHQKQYKRAPLLILTVIEWTQQPRILRTSPSPASLTFLERHAGDPPHEQSCFTPLL